jgi:hypothetical protein
MLQFIFERYGPRNISDIESLKKQLRTADDSQGYKHLLYLHRHIQNQLRKIPRRDPDTDAVLIGENGLPLNFGFTQEELRSVLMEQLGASNEAFEQIRLDAIKYPNKTYADIILVCENLLKDEKSEKSQPFKEATSSYRSVASVCSVIRSTSNNNEIICANCGLPNHYAANCRSTECKQCKYVFSSWQERQKHSISEHNRKQSTFNNNNSNFHQNNQFIRRRDRSRSNSNGRNGNNPYHRTITTNNHRPSSPYPTNNNNFRSRSPYNNNNRNNQQSQMHHHRIYNNNNGRNSNNSNNNNSRHRVSFYSTSDQSRDNNDQRNNRPPSPYYQLSNNNNGRNQGRIKSYVTQVEDNHIMIDNDEYHQHYCINDNTENQINDTDNYNDNDIFPHDQEEVNIDDEDI